MQYDSLVTFCKQEDYTFPASCRRADLSRFDNLMTLIQVKTMQRTSDI